MLRRFMVMRKKLMDASDYNIPINRSNAFRKQVESFFKHLGFIQEAALDLQSRNYSLSDCRLTLDTLQEAFCCFSKNQCHALSQMQTIKQVHWDEC